MWTSYLKALVALVQCQAAGDFSMLAVAEGDLTSRRSQGEVKVISERCTEVGNQFPGFKSFSLVDLQIKSVAQDGSVSELEFLIGCTFAGSQKFVGYCYGIGGFDCVEQHVLQPGHDLETCA